MKILLPLLAALIGLGSCSRELQFNNYHSSRSKTVPEIIRNRGYPCEEHVIVTEDGYILTLHRIPHGKKGLQNNAGYWNQKKRPFPVLMQHGLLSSSASWVLDVPFKSPAYLFADEGYDVWLGNSRGNSYSRNHTTLKLDSKAYWQFSFDEMGKYDVPATIDYILQETNANQLYYVGHSMGTTMFFSGMSINPEYNKYIRSMFALGPVATVAHIQTYIKYLSSMSYPIRVFLEYFKEYEFLPTNSLTFEILKLVCTHFSFTERICSDVIFFFTGVDHTQYSYKWLPMVMDELLSGTSLYTVLHYAQEYSSGKFQAYDYGCNENFIKYGQVTPPLYDVSFVTAPVNLIWGKNDYLADSEDVKFLIHNLPNIPYKEPVADPNFNHLDFLYAKDLYKLVYKGILMRMEH